MACLPKSLISTFLFRRAILDNTPKEKKSEIDVKESSLVFKIMQWIFLTFNIHIIDFLLLGFYPLTNEIMYFFTRKPPVRHFYSNAERELYTLLIYWN